MTFAMRHLAAFLIAMILLVVTGSSAPAQK